MKYFLLFITVLALIFFFYPFYPPDNRYSWIGYFSDSDTGIDSAMVIFTINEKEKSSEGLFHSPNNSLLNLPATVRWGDSILISVPTYGATFKGVKTGEKTMRGIYSYHPSRNYEITLEKQESYIYFPRPQTPDLQKIPYSNQEVSFSNKDGQIIRGSYSYPSQGKHYSAVILIQDRKETDRDATIVEHKPFLVLSDYLVRQGIGVLRYDKPKLVSGEKDYLETLSSDVEAALAFLKAQPEIDSKQVGLIGQGEGAVIASKVAGIRDDISFIVSMGGYGVSRAEIYRLLHRNLEMGQEMDHSLYISMPFIASRILDITYNVPYDSIVSNWGKYINHMEEVVCFFEEEWSEVWYSQISGSFMHFYNNRKEIIPDYEPAIYWRNVKCPVLILHGEKDPIVLAKLNSYAIADSVKSNGNNNVLTKIYPDLNHYFQPCEIGWPSEYTYIEETISPEVMEDIADWINIVSFFHPMIPEGD